jgi:hypothetical protein
MSVEKVLYLLSCQHKTLAQAFYVNGMLHCPLCHEERFIRDVEEMEWRANCRHCRFARWAGMSEQTATMFADAHVRKNPAHTVSVSREQHLAATKTKKKLHDWRALSHS